MILYFFAQPLDLVYLSAESPQVALSVFEELISSTLKGTYYCKKP